MSLLVGPGIGTTGCDRLRGPARRPVALLHTLRRDAELDADPLPRHAGASRCGDGIGHLVFAAVVDGVGLLMCARGSPDLVIDVALVMLHSSA